MVVTNLFVMYLDGCKFGVAGGFEAQSVPNISANRIYASSETHRTQMQSIILFFVTTRIQGRDGMAPSYGASLPLTDLTELVDRGLTNVGQSGDGGGIETHTVMVEQ